MSEASGPVAHLLVDAIFSLHFAMSPVYSLNSMVPGNLGISDVYYKAAN